MWMLVAAELPATPDNTQFYLLFAGGVVAAVASVAVAYITRNRDRTEPSPPAVDVAAAPSGSVGERIAVVEAHVKSHEKLLEDSEDRDDLQDRWLTKHDHKLEANTSTLKDHTERLEQIARHLDRDHDGWR